MTLMSQVRPTIFQSLGAWDFEMNEEWAFEFFILAEPHCVQIPRSNCQVEVKSTAVGKYTFKQKNIDYDFNEPGQRKRKSEPREK